MDTSLTDLDKVALAVEDTLNELEITIGYIISGVNAMTMPDIGRYQEGVIDGLHMTLGVIEKMKDYSE